MGAKRTGGSASGSEPTKTLRSPEPLRQTDEHSASADATRALADWAATVPALIDSPFREAVAARLAALPDSVIEAHAALAYATGTLASNRHDLPSSITWLVRAQSRVDPSEHALIARIAFELGYVYVARSEFVTADAVVAWAEALLGPHAATAADLLHLRALMAERVGSYGAATGFYHGAIAHSGSALTPLTRVLAMANLAVAVQHRSPAESLSLCNLGISIIAAGRLHPGISPAIHNIAGYALICQGDLNAARAALQFAVAAAGPANPTISRFGEFNLAIVDELTGDLAAAWQRLKRLEHASVGSSASEFVGWLSVRIAWLDVREGRFNRAERRLEDAFGNQRPVAHASAVEILLALIALKRGDARRARAELMRLSAQVLAQGDALTAFALQLWLVVLEEQGGRRQAAVRELNSAYVIGYEGGFRLSPNWWTEELVDVAKRLAADEQRSFFDALVAHASLRTDRRTAAFVRISPDGTIVVAGHRLDDAAWREGRTGSRVLRRYFQLLLSACPNGIERQALCDLLWPESEGDRAVTNLYGATNDLRRVLTAVPGVRVRAAEHRLWLELDKNVFPRVPQEVTPS